MSIFSDIFDFVFGWLVPDVDTPKAPGAELNKVGTDQYIPKIYGSVKKHNPIIVFKKTNDVDQDDFPNDMLHIMLVWGEAVESIDDFYIDDININDPNDLFLLDGNRYAYAVHFPNGVKQYDAQTQQMVAYFDPVLRNAGWSSTDTWEGKAVTYVRLEYAGGENTLSSEPQFTADITGTTETNPASQLLDYLKANKYGKGLPQSRLNTTAFESAVATCNTDVEETDGGPTRKLFTSNIALDTGETVLANTNKLLKSMRAMMPVLDGRLTPIIEKDDPAVSLEITERDIIEMGDVTNSNKNQRYNRVAVTWIDNDANGTKQEAIYPEAGSQTEIDWLAEDNGVVLDKSVTLDTCRNYYEALSFAKSYAEVSREQLRAQITLGVKGTLFETGDIVNVSHSYFGWVQKPFRIESTNESGFEVELSLREHQPYIYDFDNTGLKPEIPDTNNTRAPLVKPTSLIKIEKYNKFSLVQIQWASDFNRFQVAVIQNDEVLQYENITRKYYDIKDLPQGTYTFRVRALNSFGNRSSYASLTVVIDKDVSEFVWRAYADDANGNGINLTDNTKAFYGLSFNKDVSQSVATNADRLAADYTWFAASSGQGVDGKSIYQATVFKRASSKPSVPTGGAFNFGTNALTPPSGWSSERIEGAGNLFSSTAIFSIVGDTGTDSSTTWGAVQLDQGEGNDGTSIFNYLLYRRSSTQPATPTTGSYNFTNQTITAPSGWSSEVVEGSNPLYVVNAVAQVSGPTGTDTSPQYSTPRVLVRDGETGEDGASAFTLKNSNAGNGEITNNSATKTSGVVGWNFGAYSQESFITCSASFSANSTTGEVAMAGISNDNGSSSGFTTINYAVFFFDGAIRIYESGQFIGTYGIYTTSDIFTVTNDGLRVKYYKNGALIHTSETAPSGPYRFDCSINIVNASVENIVFSPSGAAGQSVTVIDNGDGTKTITGSNGSIVVNDGNNAPPPIITQTATTITIDNRDGDVVTFDIPEDGYTPQLDVDYFDGVSGEYVSFIFRNDTDRPATPTTGSFNGTSESFPSGWSDNPSDYTAPSKRWFSVRRYANNPRTGAWSVASNWTQPKLQAETGPAGPGAAVTIIDDDSFSTTLSSEQTVYSIALPIGNWLVEFTINGSASAVGFSGGEEVDRATRVRLKLKRDSSILQNYSDPASTFEFNHQFSVSGGVGNQAGGATISLTIDLDASGTTTSSFLSAGGFLRVTKL